VSVKHPFVWGAVVGIGGFLAWRNRGRIVALVRRIRAPFLGDDRFFSIGGRGDPAVAVRQLKRYTFASMQDQSPIVGLTHASYAMMALDLLEETVGRDAIKAAGFDPTEVRKIITGLQDAHAEKLRACDPYISKVLELERGAGGQLPGFVFADAAGAAPMGA
jgi:hypothetical protein